MKIVLSQINNFTLTSYNNMHASAHISITALNAEMAHTKQTAHTNKYLNTDCPVSHII
jgi:hypothetical protein